MRFCSRCNAPVDLETQRFCAECGAALKEERDGVIYDNTIDYEPSMRWFKFLIYFELFADAVVNILLAVVYFHDSFILIDIASTVMNGLLGLICISFSVFAIYTRFRLAGFKKNAPMCIVVLYAIPFAVRLVQLLLSILFLLNEAIIVNVMVLVVNTILLIGNYVYFKRRKYKFIN